MPVYELMRKEHVAKPVDVELLVKVIHKLVG